MIRKLRIQNFRVFRDLTIELKDGLTILVGCNEAGKSTVLEAIHLALTSRLGRHDVMKEFTTHHIHRAAVSEYLAAIREGKKAAPPPAVLIELYLDENENTKDLRGTNNSLFEDAPGVRLHIRLDPDFQAEYDQVLRDEQGNLNGVPVEYYQPEWTAFNGNGVSPRKLELAASMIDSSKIQLRSGADYYLQEVLKDALTQTERLELARAFRTAQEKFSEHQGVKNLNDTLKERKDEITDKELTMAVDTGGRSAWESGLTPHLDYLPVQYAGLGEQSMLKILLALLRRRDGSQIILLEEPENHLSFSTLNRLVAKILKLGGSHQVLLTTHSSFVLNKLGLERLLLLRGQRAMRLTDLPADTQRYFKRLPGYDTLRMVLADCVILVEGPSDELIIQRAYLDAHGRMPIEAGVDVFSVGSLAFTRFLDIAERVGTKTIMVTDNDGAPDKVTEKYGRFGSTKNIKIFYGSDPKLRTLEPQIAACNDVESLNEIFGKKFDTTDELCAYMARNKTECALRILESEHRITMPDYICEAVRA